MHAVPLAAAKVTNCYRRNRKDGVGIEQSKASPVVRQGVVWRRDGEQRLLAPVPSLTCLFPGRILRGSDVTDEEATQKGKNKQTHPFSAVVVVGVVAAGKEWFSPGHCCA